MAEPGHSATARVFTVGHSTRPLAALIALLQAHGVTHLADVRTVPRSRHNPQFNRDTLPAVLADAGIAYTHCPGLGGLRPPCAGSVNTGWRNASFRAYADYMLSEEFARSLAEVIALAEQEAVALMCAEAVPWRCHRSLIADALLVRGIVAEELVSASHREPHRLTPFAHVAGTRITYPPGPASGELF